MTRSPLICTGLILLVLPTLGCDASRNTGASSAPEQDAGTRRIAQATEESPSTEGSHMLPAMNWEEVDWRTHGKLELGPVQPIWEESGITLEQQPWRIGESRGLAWRVKLDRDGSFARVLAADDVQDFEDFLAPDDGPRVMINGGFYESSKTPGIQYEAMGVVRSRGKTHHRYVHRGGSGVLVITKDDLKIIHRSDWPEHKGKATTDALQSIDRIVDKSKALVKPKDPPGRLAARSGIALGKEHIWVIVAVSERSIRPTPEGVTLVGTSYQGMPLWGFAHYIVASTEATEALNLDGAVSTQMEVRTVNHTFSVRGERGTINAVEFRPARTK